jgi:membrane protease YdiL (CAAX protease family)
MRTSLKSILQTIFTFRWNPGLDLVVVLISVILVTASLYTAMIVVTPEVGGGMPYFFLYAGLTACVFGVGLPVVWMVFHRHRPLSDLGITRKWLVWSIILQVVFSIIQFYLTLAKTQVPSLEKVLPLAGLALAIGFFEALFWRGWVLSRLEESFGLLPAILLGSGLYAIYHIGYGMPWKEIGFLFFIGVLYAVSFRLTKSVFILWPLYQPLGQMVTLIRDELQLPLIATLGFVEALVLMLVIIWLAGRYYNKKIAKGKPLPAA